MGQFAFRMLVALIGVAAVTFAAYGNVNATTAGFAYLLLVLIIASIWGFLEAAVASVVATLTFNFFFFPPVGRFTIADPQNWVALFSFLLTALIASRLSAAAKRRTVEALDRQRDLERLYTFSRAILLIDDSESFPKQLVRKLAETFELSAVVLYERRSEEFFRAGPSDFDGLDDQLQDAALQGSSFADPQRNRAITAVRLGSEPIAGLALQGSPMPDSVLQGIANLIAIGLERARAQDLASQIEAARRSEKLRTTLLDAMAHELKTPLTSVIAATSALLADPDQSPEGQTELVRIADEEARHLKQLIDDSLDMARLDSAEIQLRLEPLNVNEIVEDVIDSMRNSIEDRTLEVTPDAHSTLIAADPRLLKLAIKQLLDNAFKYSPPDTPVNVHIQNGNGNITIKVTDHGEGIPANEQQKIFQRLYRGPSVEKRMPGFGLGLSIAQNIAKAHHGDLTVTSSPGETTFQLTLPVKQNGVHP